MDIIIPSFRDSIFHSQIFRTKRDTLYIGMIKSLGMEIGLNVPRGTLKRKGEKSGEAVRESGSRVDTGGGFEYEGKGEKNGV